MLLRPRHIRMRLTLWYVSVLAGVLILYGSATTIFLFLNLRTELDEGLVQDFATIQGLIELAPDGSIRLEGNVSDDIPIAPEQEPLMEIWTQSGVLLYRSPQLGEQALGEAPGNKPFSSKLSLFSRTLPDGSHLRMVSGTAYLGEKTILVRLAHNEEAFWNQLGKFTGVLIFGFPIALLIAGFGGFALAHRVLAPIGKMARQAQRIGVQQLDEQINIDNPDDELGHLGQIFNEMLHRIKVSFDQLKRFTADASHELRTPLTAIRSVGEVGLHNSKSEAQYREVIGSMLEEVDRLTHLVDSLLNLARADSGYLQPSFEQFQLFQIAHEACSMLDILADEKGQSLRVSGDETVVARVDRLMLHQALVNLIDNAIKFTGQGGHIDVDVRGNGASVAIEIKDTGPGISAEHREKVFEYFYRVDRARSRGRGGSGLGLSIARWAVEIQGGRIELESGNGTGSGSIFRVVLPKPSPAL